MTLTQTLQQLEAAGTAETRKTYARHGVGPNMFSFSYSTFGKLTRAIKRDHALALGLWTSGNHDARVLATMIADLAQATAALLYLQYSVAADALAYDRTLNAVY